MFQQLLVAMAAYGVQRCDTVALSVARRLEIDIRQTDRQTDRSATVAESSSSRPLSCHRCDIFYIGRNSYRSLPSTETVEVTWRSQRPSRWSEGHEDRAGHLYVTEIMNVIWRSRRSETIRNRSPRKLDSDFSPSTEMWRWLESCGGDLEGDLKVTDTTNVIWRSRRSENVWNQEIRQRFCTQSLSIQTWNHRRRSRGKIEKILVYRERRKIFPSCALLFAIVRKLRRSGCPLIRAPKCRTSRRLEFGSRQTQSPKDTPLPSDHSIGQVLWLL